MSEAGVSDILQSLKLALFQRDEQGRFALVGRAPAWLGPAGIALLDETGRLQIERSPFLENFLVDAATCWQAPGGDRVNSGPWMEPDASGHDRHMQASALTVAGRAILLLEEIGSAYEERTSILQRAHEVVLAYEKLQRAEQALAEEKRRLEQRVQERTVELSTANATLQEEVVTRRRYAERLQSVREIDRAILAAQSPEAIADAALRRLALLLPCEHASVVELEPDSGRATILANYHEGVFASGEGWQLSGEQLDQARVLGSGKTHRIAGARNLFGKRPSDPAKSGPVWRLIVDVPLVAEDTLVGVLNLATQSPGAFTPEHGEVAEEVAAQLAVAIRQARLFVQVSTGREQLRTLSLRLVDVQEAERRHMAHELHDEIGQLLTGLKMTLELPKREASEPSGAKVIEAIALVDELMDRVRQLSLDLRPTVLDDLGLLPALDWLFKRYQRQTGIVVEFRHTSLGRRLGSRLETAAFRIVQEALTNVARHAGVQEVAVRLWLNTTCLGLQVEDKGAGFEVEQAFAARASTGLAGMRERALMLGGDFTLETAPEKGTRLTVELPLTAESVPQTRAAGGAL